MWLADMNLGQCLDLDHHPGEDDLHIASLLMIQRRLIHWGLLHLVSVPIRVNPAEHLVNKGSNGEGAGAGLLPVLKATAGSLRGGKKRSFRARPLPVRVYKVCRGDGHGEILVLNVFRFCDGSAKMLDKNIAFRVYENQQAIGYGVTNLFRAQFCQRVRKGVVERFGNSGSDGCLDINLRSTRRSSVTIRQSNMYLRPFW